MQRCVCLTVLALAVNLGTALGDDQPVLDRDYLVKAAPCCDAMVKYADLAEKRAANPEVKAFARRLADEHRRLHKDLAKAAEDQKLAVASGTEKPVKEEVDRLSKLSGAEFDQAFLKRVIEDHEQGIKMCEAQGEKGTDAKLREFARTAAPRLKEHLKEAKMLAEKIK